MRKIVYIIESNWLEFGLLVYWIVFITITILIPGFSDLPERIGFFLMILLYFLRIITAFSRWKLSRGIVAVLFLLNFLLLSEAETIGIYFFGKVGFEQLLMVTNLTAKGFALIIIPVVIIKSSKKKIYWQHLNVTFFKALAGFIICNALKYL